tara:strand:- start:292 stop:927 length:636 start_codon:yes stop_codon:yes gene_type:complete
MRKITIIFISALFALTTSAFAGGMVGVKLGQGYLDGNKKAYTAGSNNYAAESGSKGSLFGAIFGEININESPLSVGIEYVPFDADISLNGQNNTVHANVDDYTSVYAVAMHESTGFYAKLGYSMADIGGVTPNDSATTINAQSDSLEGIMYGVGIQSRELPFAFGVVARAEYTRTEFDDISVTTTSNGSASVKKTADGELSTFTLSLAKSF